MEDLIEGKEIVKIKIPGVDCPDCASSLQQEVKRIEGKEWSTQSTILGPPN